MNQFFAWVKSVWMSVRQNPYFVAFEGGAGGAILNYLYDAVTTGHLDFSKTGIQKLIATAITGGIMAVKLLYRPAPSQAPKQ